MRQGGEMRLTQSNKRLIMAGYAFALSTGGLLPPNVSHANQLREMTFSEKAQKADVIVVGTAVSVNTLTTPTIVGDRYADIRINAVIKGHAADHIKVWVRTAISEMDPDCCKPGQRYVFFYEKATDGNYVVVDGNFGVIPVNP
jgi:hypothetical protein